MIILKQSIPNFYRKRLEKTSSIDATKSIGKEYLHWQIKKAGKIASGHLA
jgi:hypothetical protein